MLPSDWQKLCLIFMLEIKYHFLFNNFKKYVFSLVYTERQKKLQFFRAILTVISVIFFKMTFCDFRFFSPF